MSRGGTFTETIETSRWMPLATNTARPIRKFD